MPDDALVADVTRLLQSHFTQQEQDMSATWPLTSVRCLVFLTNSYVF